jgi:hypothetical protein
MGQSSRAVDASLAVVVCVWFEDGFDVGMRQFTLLSRVKVLALEPPETDFMDIT